MKFLLLVLVGVLFCAAGEALDETYPSIPVDFLFIAGGVHGALCVGVMNWGDR